MKRVAIRGLKMPKSCWECVYFTGTLNCGWCYARGVDGTHISSTPEDKRGTRCPLIELEEVEEE